MHTAKIISVEIIENQNQNVYNLTIADNENYFANQVLVHNCSNPSTVQSKGLSKIPAKYKVPMTGTPITNTPLDLFSILKWLGEESASFFQYKNRYCVFGGFGGHEILGYKNMVELRNRVDRIMLRRLKREVLDLPEKIRQIEYVEMTAKQALLYNEVRAMLKENIQEIILNPNPLAQLIRLRQVTGAPGIISQTIQDSAKLDRMEELVADLVANGEKVVIFSQWKEVLDFAVKRLSKYKLGIIDGSVPVIERQIIVDKFQKEKYPNVLLGTTGAMGTGLTLTAATTAIFLDLPWTEAALAQAEDRLHRIGTTGTVSIICLTARGSIDEKIIEIVKSKRDISLALIDGQMQKLNTKRLIEELLG